METQTFASLRVSKVDQDLEKNKMDILKGDWRLDGSIQSKIMAAEIERDLISQRTIEALQGRKQQGMPLGRPRGVGKSKLDDHRIEIEALLKNGSTKIWVANNYQTSVGNLRHWMRTTWNCLEREKRVKHAC